MIRPLFVLLLGGLSALASTSALASDPALVAALAPKIRAACLPDAAPGAPVGANGTIRAHALRIAIQQAGELNLTTQPQWFTSQERLSRIIARDVFAASASGTNALANDRLRRLINAWASDDRGPDAPLNLIDGGVAVTGPDGRSATSASPEVLIDILEANETGSGRDAFIYHCARPENGGVTPPRTPAPGPELQIARAPADLGLPIASRPFAEAAFVDNIEGGSTSYSIFAAAGYSWQRPRGQVTPLGILRPAYTVFAQVERQGSEATADPSEVNNLAVGAQISGFLEPSRSRAVHAFSASARYITDDSLDSEVWSVTARATPDLRLPGQIVFWPTGLSDDLEWRWVATGVADWIEIEDPGEKAKLQSAPNFGRVGYDLSADLRWRLPNLNTVTLSGTWSEREDLTDNGGDADLFAARLIWSPSQAWAVGLVYENGGNLDTLEPVEQLKITLGFRR